MTLLLQRRGDEITITDEAVSIVAARFGAKVMTFLLPRANSKTSRLE